MLQRLTLGVVAALALAASLATSTVRAAGTPNSPDAIEHALNRLAYGPRPGDVDRVQALGLSKWIDQQLHPETINDSALEPRLPAQPPRPDRFDDPMEGRRWGRESVQALAAAKITRAVYSDRQLEEVLVDFWFNHFNVFAGKGRTAMFVEEYERTAIRPHVFGKFRDLLEATAKSPAMLFYLDNWLSADPDAAEQMQRLQQQRQAQRGRTALAPPDGQVAPPPKQQRRRGLNENYGRELLELHTLGVDGGYTQKDIIEVARAFTGWTIAPEQPAQQQQQQRLQQLQQQQRDRLQQVQRQGRKGAKNGRAAQLLGRGLPGAVQEGDFRFTPALHDRGEKIVLGHKIKAGGGIEDGEQVLDIVARHPATAHHIAFQLAQRFVSDDPPKALVDRAAKKFRDTDGDLREVVRTIITSDEFFAQAARGAKVKTPFEFVVSAARATGRDLPNPRPVLNALMQMGMPLYMCQPPTGYDDTAETWVTAGSLVARMNIAQQLVPKDKDKAAQIGGPEFQRR